MPPRIRKCLEEADQIGYSSRIWSGMANVQARILGSKP